MQPPINPYEPPREISTAAPTAVLRASIRVAGKMSWSDALHAQQLAMRPAGRLTRAGRRSIGYFWFLWVVFLLSASAAVIEQPERGSSYVFLGGVLLVGAAVCYPRIRLRQEWKRGVGAFARSERLVTQQGIERQSEHSATFTPWSDFANFRHCDHIVLLYPTSGASYQVFPRAMFATDDDWQTFVEFVRAKFREG